MSDSDGNDDYATLTNSLSVNWSFKFGLCWAAAALQPRLSLRLWIQSPTQMSLFLSFCPRLCICLLFVSFPSLSLLEDLKLPVIFTSCFDNRSPPPSSPLHAFSFSSQNALFLFLLIFSSFGMPPSPSFHGFAFCQSYILHWKVSRAEKTLLCFSSPPFVVFLFPYLLFFSSLTCLLCCVFLIAWCCLSGLRLLC